MRLLILFLLLLPFAFAGCYEPSDFEHINSTVTFCSDTFDAPNGIYITTSDIRVDCSSAVIRGIKGQSNTGIIIEDVTNVTLVNCNVATFVNGIMLKNVTFSTVAENTLLKNDVGIRLFDAFENRIVDNNDKSLVKSISAINSMFNVVTLGNKGVEEGFCDVNSCNSDVPLSPCVDGDGYCSPNCGADSDCVLPVVERLPVDTRTVDEIIAGAKEKIVKNDVVELPVQEEVGRALPFSLKLAIYVGAYVLAFVIIQIHLYKKR